MSELSITGLNKAYSGRPVLRDVDVVFRSGELVSLLGPSGCGKTTLLRIIAGLEIADSGAVVLAGRDIARLPPNKRNMGMVFQAYSLFPNMTAAENVAFGLKVRGRDPQARRARVGDLLAMVGLADFHKSYPHQMSGGQQQRVALARALAIEPALLLLDEPLSALDAKVRVQLREEIRRIQRETGVTTIFVTHDQEEALSISDRVAVMFQGRIDQFDVPSAIYEKPQTKFVVEFIGITSRLQGKVTDSARGLVDISGTALIDERARALPAGAPVSIYFRPEAIEVSPAGQTGALPGPEGLKGTVSELTFMGANTRVTVAVPGQGEVLADMPTSRSLHLPVGLPVHVGWRPGTAHMVPPDA